MALVSQDLEVSLQRAMTPRGAWTAVKAASEVAKAYQTYTAAAMAGVALPVFTGAEAQALTSALGALTPEGGNAASFASAWVSGISGFWMASPAPVLFTDGVNSGVVLVIPGLPAFQTALVGMTSSTIPTVGAAARALAQALDALTRSIPILLQPSGVTVPLT